VQRSGYYEYLNAGAIITGGGSLLPGTEELAHDVFGLDVRIGYPEGVSGGIKGSVNNPMYATVMGLVAHAFQNNLSVDHSFALTAEVLPVDATSGIREEPLAQEQSPAGKKIVDRMKKFWDNL
jgi:cell division protein FtsA